MTAKKPALGKGLSALLHQSGSEVQPTYDVEKDLPAVGTIVRIQLEQIGKNPFQPRSDFDEDSLSELAASIREQGVIQPVTVRKSRDGQLQLIAGERRLKASAMAGLKDIPAYIINAPDHAMLEMAIVENIQRENLNPIEIALGYQQLIGDYQLTQEMLSERLGKSRSSIANYLRLLKLPGDIQLALRREVITMGHAKALLALEETSQQLSLFGEILQHALSVREVEKRVKQRLLSGVPPQDSKREPDGRDGVPASGWHESETRLSTCLNTKVEIKSRNGDRGTIRIHFSSPEDMERILAKLYAES